jgi:hypothetical protein
MAPAANWYIPLQKLPALVNFICYGWHQLQLIYSTAIIYGAHPALVIFIFPKARLGGLQPAPGYFIELTQHWLFLFLGCNQYLVILYNSPSTGYFYFPKSAFGGWNNNQGCNQYLVIL